MGAATILHSRTPRLATESIAQHLHSSYSSSAPPDFRNPLNGLRRPFRAVTSGACVTSVQYSQPSCSKVAPHGTWHLAPSTCLFHVAFTWSPRKSRPRLHFQPTFATSPTEIVDSIYFPFHILLLNFDGHLAPELGTKPGLKASDYTIKC